VLELLQIMVEIFDDVLLDGVGMAPQLLVIG